MESLIKHRCCRLSTVDRRSQIDKKMMMLWIWVESCLESWISKTQMLQRWRKQRPASSRRCASSSLVWRARIGISLPLFVEQQHQKESNNGPCNDRSPKGRSSRLRSVSTKVLNNQIRFYGGVFSGKISIFHHDHVVVRLLLRWIPSVRRSGLVSLSTAATSVCPSAGDAKQMNQVQHRPWPSWRS